MKKIFLFIAILTLSFTTKAGDKVDELSIIYTETGPSKETNEDEENIIIFYDAQGRVISVNYSYNSTTNTLNVQNGSGAFYCVITNKKTGKTKVIKLAVILQSS